MDFVKIDGSLMQGLASKPCCSKRCARWST